MLRETVDGVLLSPVAAVGRIEQASDGLPVLHVGYPVANDETVAAIDQERAER